VPDVAEPGVQAEAKPCRGVPGWASVGPRAGWPRHSPTRRFCASGTAISTPRLQTGSRCACRDTCRTYPSSGPLVVVGSVRANEQHQRLGTSPSDPRRFLHPRTRSLDVAPTFYSPLWSDVYVRTRTECEARSRRPEDATRAHLKVRERNARRGSAEIARPSGDPFVRSGPKRRPSCDGGLRRQRLVRDARGSVSRGSS
jgi:hypothetical protein